MKKIKITRGFKNSALGIIPKEWDVKKIGDLTKTTAGGTPSTTHRSYWGGDIKWMSSGELNLKRIIDVDGRITEDGLRNSSTKLIPKGCVLVGLAGQGKTRGTVAINLVELCTNQSVAAIFPSKSFNAEFLYYNLDSRYDELRQLSTGDGGRGGLNLNIINSIQIPLPKLSEQAAIAKCLSTWDRAIEVANKLIEQKEFQKKWLTKQLLSSKKKLNGFEREKWKELKLKDLFEEVTASNDGVASHKIMTISSKRGLITQEDKFDRVIAGESLKKYTLLEQNDFAYNKGNSKTYPMGCIYQLDVEKSALVPFVYICFRPTDKVHSAFYKFWFLAHGFDRQLKTIITSGARGDGLLNVNSDDFFNLKLPYPTKREQQAISKVLQTMDNEIVVLQNKLTLLVKQKKGLMQQLLTGKKRLKY
jgi:type I restriction enzyme S subunit